MRYQQAKKNLKEVAEYIRALEAKVNDLEAQIDTFKSLIKGA